MMGERRGQIELKISIGRGINAWERQRPEKEREDHQNTIEDREEEERKGHKEGRGGWGRTKKRGQIGWART